MIAFHGSVEIKEKYLARVAAHRAADELVQGFGYWQKDGAGQFKGCAVGCTLHSSDHAAYEVELGIPRMLARLEDGIFERLPAERAKTWPEEFLKAATVGADLSQVWPQFAVWLMVDAKWGVVNFAKMEATKEAILKVADLYRRMGTVDALSRGEIRAVAGAARRRYYGIADAAAAAAAADAADDAAAAAAADAADAAAADADAAAAADADAAAAAAAAADAADAAAADADAAAAAAAAAADAADDAAAAAAADAAAADAAFYWNKKYNETRASARLAQAEKLLELMAAAPVGAAAEVVAHGS